MCGRFTYKLTWEELVRLYRLTLDQSARNTQPRYNVCPTDPVDTVVDATESSNSSRQPLTTAGLWDEWRDRASGETVKSCTMIITEPNEFVAEVHDRMPVLLAEKDFEPWLSGSGGLELLKPAANDLLQKWPVSKRVNSSKAPADDPTLIEQVAV